MRISTEFIEGTPEFFDAYHAFRNEGPLIAQTGISLEQQLLFLYREALRLELEERLKGAFWISQDIATAAHAIILPGEIQNIPIELPRELGPFTDLHEYSFSLIQSCTRSRFGQLGLEVPPNTGMYIAGTIRKIGDNGSSKRVAYIPVINYAARPIALNEGTKFFYFYYGNEKPLRGNDLTQFLGSDITVSGEQGRDWDWWYESLPSGEQGEIQGIELFLDEKSFKTIPAHTESISIDDTSITNHNRQGVDQFLCVADQPQCSQLYVAETKSHLKIGSRLHGILDQLHTRYDGKIHSGEKFYQTNSVVFQGGNTNSRIRVEVLCDDEWPSSVFVAFWPAKAGV